QAHHHPGTRSLSRTNKTRSPRGGARKSSALFSLLHRTREHQPRRPRHPTERCSDGQPVLVRKLNNRTLRDRRHEAQDVPPTLRPFTPALTPKGCNPVAAGKASPRAPSTVQSRATPAP